MAEVALEPLEGSVDIGQFAAEIDAQVRFAAGPEGHPRHHCNLRVLQEMVGKAAGVARP